MQDFSAIQDLFGMQEHPATPALLNIGANALSTGKVSPGEVVAAQQAISTPKGFNTVKDMVDRLNGKKSSKQEKKTSEDTKKSTTHNLYMDPEELQARVAGIESIPGLADQRAGIDEMEKMLSMQAQNQPEDHSYIPQGLAALADTWSGSNLSAKLPHMETQSDRNRQMMDSMQELQKRKGDLSKMVFEGIQKTKAGSETESSNKHLMDSLALMAGPMGGPGAYAEVRRNKLISDSGAAFDKDPLLKSITSTNNNLNRAISMMDGKAPVTAKNFAILQNDMINAMAPGGAATEGRINREMVKTLSTMINEIQQKFGDTQDLRKADPQLFTQLKQLIKQIKADYGTAGLDRAATIKDNYTNVPDSDVQATVQRKFDYWKNKAAESAEAPETPKRTKKLEDMSDAELDAYEKSLHKGG